MNKLSFVKITSSHLLSYWADEKFGWAISPTADFFAGQIDTGNFEAWTAQINGEIVGELHLARSLSDRDFADGEARCYVCDFRVKQSLRGQGIGTALLRYVIQRAEILGFREVSIGVDENHEANLRLYLREGFTEKIKTTLLDPCNIGADGKPCPDSFLLLVKPLYSEQ